MASSSSSPYRAGYLISALKVTSAQPDQPPLTFTSRLLTLPPDTSPLRILLVRLTEIARTSDLRRSSTLTICLSYLTYCIRVDSTYLIRPRSPQPPSTVVGK
ncbi:hypothetical protein BDW02DRAFT_572265 [Decorospora gaudefroyi]|uniref:Uncharacterized protein n=1 Tax=Decorospora gaudefroyi TaxID=184978 RepID=A0A6A5K0U2_9PLEO|nr:hypothetical protein BDW02DRAFT_572265 [Decorospora gaudefroyi]